MYTFLIGSARSGLYAQPIRVRRGCRVDSFQLRLMNFASSENTLLIMEWTNTTVAATKNIVWYRESTNFNVSEAYLHWFH